MINTEQDNSWKVLFWTIFLFRQLWGFGSLLSNIFIDDFTARQ